MAGTPEWSAGQDCGLFPAVYSCDLNFVVGTPALVWTKVSRTENAQELGAYMCEPISKYRG